MGISSTGIDIVGAFFTSLGEGDAPTALGLLAPDARWTYHGPSDVIPWGGTFTGPEGVGEFFGKFGTAADGLEMTPRSMVEADGLVYVRGIERSRVKATGKEYAVEWVHVVATANGKITSFDEYIDSAAVAAALS